MSDATFPSVKQELDRKTLEFLEHTLHRYEAGRLSPETALLRAQAAWDITTGLVDKEVTDLAVAVASEIKAKADQLSIYLRHATKGVLRIRYAQEQANFAACHWSPDGPPEGVAVEHKCEPGMRAERIATLVRALVTKGGWTII